MEQPCLSISVEVSLVQALLVSIFSIQFSSLFIEIPYPVVRSAIMQKFSTTTILYTSSFSAFSPDAYVCCDPTDEVSFGCGHFGKYSLSVLSVGRMYIPHSKQYWRIVGSIYYIVNSLGGLDLQFAKVSFCSSSCECQIFSSVLLSVSNLCSIILCVVAISLVYVESNVTSQMVSVKTYLLSPPSPNGGRAGCLFLMVRDVDGGSTCARFYSGNSSSFLLPVVLSDLVGLNFLPGAGFCSMACSCWKLGGWEESRMIFLRFILKFDVAVNSLFCWFLEASKDLFRLYANFFFIPPEAIGSFKIRRGSLFHVFWLSLSITAHELQMVCTDVRAGEGPRFHACSDGAGDPVTPPVKSAGPKPGLRRREGVQVAIGCLIF
ncbi:hypothetical protein MTR67_030583 [Solanum verrucosum]|uniref:Uncharacterized protein n=1 Tax=Solanum verrucosum TaxID=315347 RepID=A0AAF0R9L1_SOLVR|nr:hypothetical protein MTR67_030583 [Solanum verrucosum]